MTEDVNAADVASENKDESYETKWGLSLEEIYKVAVDQYKKGMWGPLGCITCSYLSDTRVSGIGKEDIKLNYEDKLNALAYWRQATRGKWDESKTQDVGYFDVIGNDRKKAWQALGDMDQEEARRKFVELLLSRHPSLSQTLDGMKREKEEKERQERERREKEAREAAAREEERLRRLREEEDRRRQEEERSGCVLLEFVFLSKCCFFFQT
jgi:acyl-CoA-binding protein